VEKKTAEREQLHFNQAMLIIYKLLLNSNVIMLTETLKGLVSM